MNDTQRQHLRDVVTSLLGSDVDSAKEAFKAYSQSKSREIVSESAKSKGNPELTKYVNAAGWPRDLEAAKKYGHEAITKWDFTEKAAKFHRIVDDATSVAAVQKVVINTLLSGEGLATIKKGKK